MERPGEAHVPEFQLFDPALSPAPPLPGVEGGSAVVLLAAAPRAREDQWAERAAAGLASGWADQGRRVLLVDLALARPRLDRVLGAALDEGVTDALLFGSSVKRIAQRVTGEPFLFLSAGTATARPEAVASSGRWAAIVEDCASKGTTLVVFLPSQLPGGEALLARASDVLLLAESAEDRDGALARGLGPRLRAVLVPPESPAESEQEAAPGDDGSRADHGGDRTTAELGADSAESELASVRWAEPPPPSPSQGPGPGEEGKVLGRPAPPPVRSRRVSVLPEPTPSLSRKGLVIGILVLVVAAVAALAWFGIIQVPELSEWLATFR